MRRQNVLMLIVPIMWGRAVRCIHLVIERSTPLPFRWLVDDTICTLVWGKKLFFYCTTSLITDSKYTYVTY